MKHYLFWFIFIIIIVAFSLPAVAAPSDQGLGCGGGFGPIGDALCNMTGNPAADSDIVGTQTNKIISGIIGFLTVCASLWFGLQMILGGYDWINSAGDKGKLETARNKIVYAILGIIIVVAAWIIIGLIGTLLGIDILNPGEILKNAGQ